MALAETLWKSWRPPLGDSRKYTVIIAREASTSRPTTSRLFRGPAVREE
jgi:hypothetical protein